MKKIIEGVFFILLMGFSFFYTDRVMNMINKKDPLMTEIINVKSSYEVLPVNAITTDDTIIPGIKGKSVIINDSYDNMKIGGVFREDALVFKDLYPSSSLKDNRDKYIIKGSSVKREVALVMIYNDKYIDSILSIDNISLFVNHRDISLKNINLLKEKEIYTYGNNGVYSDEVLVSDNTIINRTSNNKSKYCLVKEKNKDVLEYCSKNGMYVVIPNIIGNYYDVKNNLSNGSIILLDSLSDIDMIIKYINSRGYNIVGLNSLLSE